MPKKNELSYNLKKLTRAQIADLFDVQVRAVTEWAGQGCPRNTDKTYNLKKVIKWKHKKVASQVAGGAKHDAEVRRLELQAQKLELDLSEKRKNFVTREEFLDIQQKQAAAIMEFFQDGYKRNAQLMMRKLGLAGSDLKTFLSVWDGFIKSALDFFCESGIDIDR